MRISAKSNQNTSRNTVRTSGFSMVELIVTIFTISVLAGISVVAVGKITQSAQQKKIESDVNTINSSIKIYLANGGDLSGVTTVEGVLNRLKTSKSRNAKKLHVGAPSGRMIDVRTIAVPVPADSGRNRANYDVASKRLIVSATGNGFEFDHDENLNEAFFGLENRSSGPVSYASRSKWVWDYVKVRNPSGPHGPNVVTVTEPPADVDPDPDSNPIPDPDTDPDPDPDPGQAPKPDPDQPRLPTPYFSLGSGGYPDTQFPLSVTITNVPAASDASVIVRIGSGEWTAYTGSISIPAEPTAIRAQFRAVDPAAFRDGYTRYASYYPIASSLDGSLESVFHSPTGGSNMQYDLSADGNTFIHGSNEYNPGGSGDPIPIGDPNSLKISPANFASVTPGVEFKLIDIFYHNGNSFYDSNADYVKLNLKINVPEANQTVDFDVPLELVNTQNDPSDPAASADYVRLTTRSKNLGLIINGVSYKLTFRFYSVDSSGFNTNSRFHVYEGNTAQAEIRGKFIAIP